MEHLQIDTDLLRQNAILQERLDEYKELVEAIRSGSIDALAINKDGRHDVFTLESTDYIYRVLVENFGESALNITENGLIMYANTAFENLLGCSASSITGTDLHELIDESDKAEFKRMFSSAFSGASRGELILSYKGKKIPIYASLSSLYPRFQGIGVILTDLSQKKKTETITHDLEQRLYEYNNLLQHIFDSSIEIIMTFDKELKYTSANSAALQFLHRRPEDIIGKNIIEVFPRFGVTEHFGYMVKALKGEYTAKSGIKSGSRQDMVLDLNIAPLMIGKQVNGVLVMARNVGSAVQTKQVLEEINRDLESRNKELIRSNAELEAINKIGFKDLQISLRKIHSSSQELLLKFASEKLEKLLQTSEQMQKMVDVVLNHSKPGLASEFSTVSLQQIIQDARKTLGQSLLRNEVSIESDNLPVVSGIPTLLHQLFVNLLEHAMSLRRMDNPLVIQIGAELINENSAVRHQLPPSHYWYIYISDNGAGFEPRLNEKIFDLSAAMDEKQTLGIDPLSLLICRKIAEDHKGFIRANGWPGIGERFDIFLPRLSDGSSYNVAAVG
jgi:PAS domain S-box-containing protein